MTPMPYFDVEIRVTLVKKERMYFESRDEAERVASALSCEWDDGDYDWAEPVWYVREAEASDHVPANQYEQ